MITKDFVREYEKLNTQQKDAVDSIEGPVMVVAGPGTGKTQMLALRIANILKTTDAKPENILCLTFTDSGVKAMKQRLLKLIGNDTYKIAIHTFHSFTNEIINAFPEKFRFKSNALQLDELNRIKIIQNIIDEKESDIKHLISFHNKYIKQNDIIYAIQELKKEGISSLKLKNRAEKLIENHKENVKLKAGKPTKKWEEQLKKYEALFQLHIIYSEYEKILEEESLYDFDDMILMAINAFETDDSLLAYFQEKYLYIHVDEYQDTNGSQNKIIELLGNFDDYPNIFVVGDDDQAIYRFQGANIQNILFFNQVFKNVKIISTVHNYRSSQIILNSAQSIIRNNKLRLENTIETLTKKLLANANHSNEKIFIAEFNNQDSENNFIAKKIKELIDTGVDPKEIAIIFRKNAHALDISESLNKAGIKTRIKSSRGIFENEIIALIISLLNIINLNYKILDLELYNFLKSDLLNLQPVSLYQLSKYSYKNKIRFDTLFFEGDFNEINLNENDKKILLDLREKILNIHKKSNTINIARLFELMLQEFNILDYLKSKEIETTLSVNKFYDFINFQSKINVNYLISNLLKDLEIIHSNRISIDLPENNITQNSVNLITAHSSKGLEFEYVFIVKATQNNWGSTRAKYSIITSDFYEINESLELEESNIATEDERRLFFVALTRAKKEVFITYANEYLQDNGSVTTTFPTQFIEEIDEDHKVINKWAEENLSKEELLVKLNPLINNTLSIPEKDFLLEQIDDFTMSPSALNLYLESPLDFKYQYLIRVPKLRDKDAELGTAIHASLERFNKSLMKNIRLPLDSILAYFEECLKREFYAHDEYERTLLQGKEILTKYYLNIIEKNLYNTPIESEYNFTFHNVYLRPLDNEFLPIKLAGTVDKIELLDEAENIVRIVDYKTGSYKSANAIMGKTKNDSGSEWRQILFYALLTDLDTLFRPGRKPNTKKYNVTSARIEYIKDLKSVDFEIQKEDLIKMKSLIIEVMNEIRNLNFPEKTDILQRFDFNT